MCFRKKHKEKKPEKTQLGIYRLKYDKKERDWVIIRDNAKQASKRCKTKEEALKALSEFEKNQDVGSVIHKKDGKWQKKS